MEKVVFSIITPTLNEEKFYPRLLRDLTKQTFRDFEVIHVDGRSEDKTRELAQKISKDLPNFNQIIAKKRHVSFQRNLGANSSNGKYLVFIDADTQLPPHFLEELSDKLSEKPADIFTTWAIPDSNRAADAAFITMINIGIEISIFVESPAAIGVFMGSTKEAFDKIGGFPEDVKYGEDEDFVKTGYKKKLKFHIYRQPRYVYSLRRFRKEGTITSLQQMAQKRLFMLTGDEAFKPTGYAMGGHIFKKDDVNKSILDRIDDFLTQVANTALPKIQQEKLKKFLKKLIED